MNKRIMAVDDDYGTLKLIETILIKEEYYITTFTSPVDALKNLKSEHYDCILSDFFMPEMNGDQFLAKVRKDNDVPIIMLTVNKEIANIVELMKQGADDYINKPIIREDLLFRINKTIEEKDNKRLIERIQKEREILSFDNQRLADWKTLYATKDIKQTELVIKLITRNMNQGGGYVWVDLLKNNIKKIDDGHYQINKSLVNIILKAAEHNIQFFDIITLLSKIDEMKLDRDRYSYTDFQKMITGFLTGECESLIIENNRKLLIQQNSQHGNGFITIDTEYFKKILFELVINAIKYSPDSSNIIFEMEYKSELKNNQVTLVLKNEPKRLGIKNSDGNLIAGIPYEYSELIFDLFYTIEAFPTTINHEQWINGSGLFIVRKLLKKQHGWIKTVNEVDYSSGGNKARIKFLVTLPITD